MVILCIYCLRYIKIYRLQITFILLLVFYFALFM